ncbi:MAG TPA: acetate/propionate family kinase [Syntrophales bacterium]|jgi:acetate kinase|nr:acetate/propionate family kinase [Syntrophales bacterium]HON22296.1 acetate/propionate family kinase [Syntrophales bacterium]HOU76672.1 acetate/propionate family kinase [Syntrophales bacterium]HPC31429.1 acetate/propionate family kinase [Syntrophales bacterium]HQG33335.1 acetate/propionate family kinase [Syntrophales bacterium]
MELENFFKSINILGDLSSEEIGFLAASSQLIDFPPSAVIIKAGEIGRFLWLVYDGEVEVSLPDETGKERVLASLERGSFFGEMSILTGEPAAANVVSTRSCKAVKIPREVISQVVSRNPKTLMKVTRIITKRLLEDEKFIEEVKERRLAHSRNEDPYDLNFTSVSEPMKILVVNSGSSSLKYSFFDTTRKESLLDGLVEKIGSAAATHTIKKAGKKTSLPGNDIATVSDAFHAMVAALGHEEHGAVGDVKNISAVGHRVVHGGQRFSSSMTISDEVMNAIRECIPIAPLHNPYNLEGIETLKKLLPGVPQVAVFDTAFHLNMPEAAYRYALPVELCDEEQIRRFGFHGTNHRFVSLSAATALKIPIGDLKIISCHLGSGASVCAVDHGRSIDTSMGMTPLEGLVMGTRGGDVDPGVLLHLMRHAGLSCNEIDAILNKESGLKGLSGKSNDMREVLEAAEGGDMRCKMAISVFCYRVKKYIGAYIAALGGLDVLIFTGGIGENSPEIRARICQGMEVFGIAVTDDINRRTVAMRGQVVDISDTSAKIRILVVPADEERMIARETIHALGRSLAVTEMERLRSKAIPLSVSAHHVHLCQEDFEALFGPGRSLTPRSELSQPGQFAAAETVNLIGPKGRVEKVRILGPLRKESQVEIARTEQFRLGIDAPIRDSGDIEGTPGVIMEGEAGQVVLEKGVICAKRHIHMAPEEALSLGLRDKDVVMVKVKGVRELIFGDVLIRVNPSYRMDMHLDTDEANAAQISPGTVGYIEAIQHRNYV